MSRQSTQAVRHQNVSLGICMSVITISYPCQVFDLSTSKWVQKSAVSWASFPPILSLVCSSILESKRCYTLAGVLNTRGLRTICNFQSMFRCILEAVQNMPMVAMDR